MNHMHHLNFRYLTSYYANTNCSRLERLFRPRIAYALRKPDVDIFVGIAKSSQQCYRKKNEFECRDIYTRICLK